MTTHEDPAHSIVKDGFLLIEYYDIDQDADTGYWFKHRATNKITFNELTMYSYQDYGLMVTVHDGVNGGSDTVIYPWSNVITVQVVCNSPKVAEEIRVARDSWELDNVQIPSREEFEGWQDM